MELISILPWAQIVLSVALSIVILLQVNSEGGLGGAFGGSDSTASFRTKRGIEKVLFITSIVIAVLFALSAFISLLLSKNDTSAITVETLDIDAETATVETVVIDENMEDSTTHSN